MQADRKAHHTIDSYLRGARYYLAWCATEPDEHPFTKPTLQRWITHLLDSGAEPTTARIRQQAVRRFAAWLFDEEELDHDPFLGLKPPKLDTKIVQRLTDNELRLMLKACAGKELHDRRDEACLRLLVETGMRAGELLALSVHDIDLARGVVTIRKGKGGRGRHAPFQTQTGAAIDRYLRLRQRHPLSNTSALWLTETGGRAQLGYHGLRVALLTRATAAGIEGFHIHRLRHTFASRYLSQGGTEGSLMQVAGWRTRQMVDRYSKDTAAERAITETRRLKLGDL
ncbi:tyrosine-type recombinase/integrase [Mycobacterium heidelbergense]|uniref:Integrase n=2 Tax=Mycobacterium heidelbergense TaxID=53376 RepID=A0A1X0DCE5_MYCHE|nr:tyrosine-type recombinase/integrase [Mycobacterium heidelbergense]ORA69998.1 integrase [Mycobacterium heidelbergense]